MRDLNKISELRQLSLFSLDCESASRFEEIHPDEADAVNTPCKGRNRLNVVTCHDSGRDQDIADAGGLKMNATLKMQGANLPEFIPIIPRGMFKSKKLKIRSKYVGVVLNDILTKGLALKHGHHHLPDGATINSLILNNPIFAGKKVILFSTGPDTLIEDLWWNRKNAALFQLLKQAGFAAITGMNFSVIDGECPFDHALNIKKSINYCARLDELDVWTIPHIYAINKYQRERWKKWLLANPNVKMVTINSQLQRNQKQSMRIVFETIRFLLESTSVEIILHGRSKSIYNYINKTFNKRLHFAASGPLKRALIWKDKSLEKHICEFLKNLKQTDGLISAERIMQKPRIRINVTQRPIRLRQSQSRRTKIRSL